MEEKRLREDSACCRENAEKKQPYSHRDIKRKLSLLKRKIDDLQHQRKIAYKNSVKVKRIIHNQINQIVKCLRSRERCLWSEIDDAYLSQDENISQELLRLQTIYSNCLVRIEDNPQNAKALSKIYCTLVQANCEEKLNSKALEFSSEFETLKTVAANFGNLTGDFCKNDEFVVIDKDSSPNITCERISNNRENSKTVCETNIRKEDSSNEYLSINSDLEDLFEVITFNDSMSCEGSENDFHMVDQHNFENGCQQIENLNNFNKIGNELKDSKKSDNSRKKSKDEDFNAEEEWKQLFELKSRISSISGMLPKLENKSSNSGNQTAKSNNLNAVKSSNEFVYLSSNEVNDWLPQKRAKKDNVLKNKCTWQSKPLFGNRDGLLKVNSEKHETSKSCDRSQIDVQIKLSPAEIVRREFKKYFVKDGIENWLSQHYHK